jgi:predicted transposase YbfD/YdcC
VRREWIHLKKEEREVLKEALKAGDLEIKTHDRYFLSSHPAEEAKKIAEQARTHWSVENKNHYKKDVSLWVEDDHRHRRVNAAQNLALMRSALLAIIPFDEKKTLNDCFGDYDKKPNHAIRLIQKAQPI